MAGDTHGQNELARRKKLADEGPWKQRFTRGTIDLATTPHASDLALVQTASNHKISA